MPTMKYSHLTLDHTVSEKNITEVSFPKTLKSIGDWAFWGCEALESISLPENLESLGEVAFEKCTSLKNITVAEGNKNFVVKDGVLYSKDLKTLLLYPCAIEGENFDIPNGVENIGKYAFDYNRYLSLITIPDSVKSFGKGIPFTEAKSIKAINVSKNNAAFKSLDGNLYSRDGRTLIKYAIGKSNKEFEVPYGVEKIEDRAFKNCESLENITIPDTVISIGNGTFENNIKITACEGSMAYDYAIKKGYDLITTPAKKIVSIEIYKLPVKTVFVLGDEQDTVGMVIRLNYEDRTYGLRNSGFTTSGFDSGKPGECEITVIYGGFETSYKVQIVEETEPVTEAPTQKPTVAPTTAKVKVGTASVKSASKKKASAKAKISLKKVKGATKYQIQISSSKKFKKVLAKKTVKSVSFTLKSKKIKNKKLLYIRARVIKTVGRKSYSGKWSKPKKVTIKK